MALACTPAVNIVEPTPPEKGGPLSLGPWSCEGAARICQCRFNSGAAAAPPGPIFRLMDDARRTFEEHLNGPRGRGALADAPFSGAAGGAACGDLIRISIRPEGGRIGEAGFDASGCGAVAAAGSAVVALVSGSAFLDAARVGPNDIDKALGGL